MTHLDQPPRYVPLIDETYWHEDDAARQPAFSWGVTGVIALSSSVLSLALYGAGHLVGVW